MNKLIVRHQHIYATQVSGSQLCSTGARVWFTEHGLSWNDFIAQGIDADRLLATGDAFAIAVVETAKRMEVTHGGQ